MESIKNRDRGKTAKSLLAMRRPVTSPIYPDPYVHCWPEQLLPDPPDTAKRRGVDEYDDASTATSESHGEDDDLDLPPHPS